MDILDVLYQYRRAYLGGLLVTLKICAIAWTGGIIGGGILASAAEWWPRLAGWPVVLLSRVTEAIPILVLLYWLHYPIQAALGVVVEPFYTIVALLTTLNTLAVFGVLRAAITRIPAEMIEVAIVCGVRRRRVFWDIQLPLALRAALGSLTSSQVNVLQLSIFGGLISVEELFRISQRINSQIYRPVEVYSGLALFFLLICLPVNFLARALENRLAYDG